MTLTPAYPRAWDGAERHFRSLTCLQLPLPGPWVPRFWICLLIPLSGRWQGRTEEGAPPERAEWAAAACHRLPTPWAPGTLQPFLLLTSVGPRDGVLESGGRWVVAFRARLFELEGCERCKKICKWMGQAGASEPSRSMKDRMGEEEGDVAGSSIITVTIHVVLCPRQALS